MTEPVHTGGCLCGAVRFAATGRPVSTNICHCEMCRRAGGAPVVAWATFPDDKIKFEGKPTWRKSSDVAERAFCAQCGSALCWRPFSKPHEVDMTVGTFDKPDELKPQDHLWMDNKISWLNIADDLPKYHTNRKSGVVKQ